MKRLASLSVLLLVSAAVVFAGEPKPMTRTGDKAVLFDLGGLADLAAGNYGGGVGFKYYVAPDLGIRLALGYNTSKQTTDNPATTIPAGQLAESERTDDNFTIGPAITYNIAKSSTIAAYVGGMISYTWTSSKRTGNSGGLGVGYISGSEYKQTSDAFAVAAIFGVEWWAWENISFSGEYRLGYNHSTSQTRQETATTSVTTDGPETSGFGMGSANAAALTLSVYF